MNLGAILLARQIMHSEVWTDKPAWWYKVWSFILMHVNHTGNSKFKRGENLFSYNQIHYECHLINDGIKKESVDNVIRWLRRTKRITTRKTTRGIVITVCNYDTYQLLRNYRNEIENDTGNEMKTRQERDENETINKNDINDKNINIYIGGDSENSDVLPDVKIPTEENSDERKVEIAWTKATSQVVRPRDRSAVENYVKSQGLEWCLVAIKANGVKFKRQSFIGQCFFQYQKLEEQNEQNQSNSKRDFSKQKSAVGETIEL